MQSLAVRLLGAFQGFFDPWRFGGRCSLRGRRWLIRLEVIRAPSVLIVMDDAETPAESLARAFGGGPVKPHVLVKTGVPRALGAYETDRDGMA